ncbi:P-loop domain-containing protein, partial [Staphylococcus epidermidis]
MIDEDRCGRNLMIGDGGMEGLIGGEKEGIRRFCNKVKGLYE